MPISVATSSRSVACSSMLTGRQAFEGETVSEILASILKTDADFRLLPSRLNPRLVEVLRRCLEKNPKKRWHSASDIRIEIEAASGAGLVAEQVRPVEATARPLWRRVALPIATALIGGLAAGYAAWSMKPEPARTITRFSVALPDGQQFSNTGRNVVALSPDGRNLVYVANQGLHLRAMGSLESRAIAGAESPNGVVNPVFSPDGQSVVFWSTHESALKRIAISGGAAITVCQATNPLGISWDEHGIVFGQADKGVMRVSALGGTPEVIASAGGDEILSTPQILPGGKVVLFSFRKLAEGWDRARIATQPLGGGERKVLVEGASAGRYLATGHLVYGISGSLVAVAFDPATLTVSGSPIPIVEGVRRSVQTALLVATTGVAHVSFSSTGSLAFVPGPVVIAEAGTDLALFDRKGGAQRLNLPVGVYSSPRVSPDGKFVVFERFDGRETSIWVYELSAGRAPQRLTFGGNNSAPVWSPDARTIVFESDREGDHAIFVQRADGSGTAERLSKPDAGQTHTPHSWSPDGEHLLFSIVKAADEVTLWTMTVKDRKVAPFGQVRAREAVFSPDGRWVAYQTREEGANVVYVEPFPRTGAKYLVPQRGGHPFWSPKSDELIMNIAPNQSASVAFSTAPRVAFGRSADFPRRGRQETSPAVARRNVDMMPDGQHVIGVLSQSATEGSLAQQPQITVVLNWFDELRERVPVR